MNTTAGRCNVRSVNGRVKLSVTFHSNHGISFLSEPEATLRTFLMHFEQHVGLRNQTRLWGGGRKMDVVPFYRNWRENETT